MALRWNLEGIKDRDTVCWLTASEDEPTRGITKGDRILNPLTEVLIFATVAVDLGEITEENAGEFFARLRFTERLDGPFLIRAVGEDGKRPEGSRAFITEDEVLAHIGLGCNVSSKTRAQWLKRFNQDLDSLARKAKQKQAVIA